MKDGLAVCDRSFDRIIFGALIHDHFIFFAILKVLSSYDTRWPVYLALFEIQSIDQD